MFVTTTAAVVWGSYKKVDRPVGRRRPGSLLLSDAFVTTGVEFRNFLAHRRRCLVLEQTGHCVRGRRAVGVALDFGKSSRGGLRGSYPELGLGWQLRPWCSAHAVVP